MRRLPLAMLVFMLAAGSLTGCGGEEAGSG